MPTLNRHVLAVRETLRFAVSLIAAGHHNTLHDSAVDAASLHEVVGAANVGLEGLQWAAHRHPHQGLRSQMKHGVGLVLVDGSLQRPVVLESAIHYPGPIDVAAANELTLRVPIADKN